MLECSDSTRMAASTLRTQYEPAALPSSVSFIVGKVVHVTIVSAGLVAIVRSTRCLLALDLGTHVGNTEWQAWTKLRSWPFRAGISGGHFRGKECFGNQVTEESASYCTELRVLPWKCRGSLA